MLCSDVLAGLLATVAAGLLAAVAGGLLATVAKGLLAAVAGGLLLMAQPAYSRPTQLLPSQEASGCDIGQV